MREQILELIQTKPKHFSKLVSSNPNLLTWVQQNTLVQSTNLSEMIYSALHKETNLCKNGKIKKFDRISTGFIGCGPAKMCSCTKNAISSNVSASKQLYTSDQKIQINEKRKQTMISKYGVPYNLQRSDVKQKLVKPKISDNAFDKLNSYEWLNNEYNVKKRSLVEIADELNVYYSTVSEYCMKLGFSIRQTSSYSLVETQIKSFVMGLGFNVVQHDWSILKDREIDLYIPDAKVGIEVNGLYWHSWSPKNNKPEDKNRHIAKTLTAASAGVSLIHITDYEWTNKQEMVKFLLMSKLGKNEKLYARSCSVNEVPKAEQKLFLNKYHLQGYVQATTAVGLYHNNELVMLVTVGTARFKNKAQHEILRVCSMGGITVVGGLSKLLRYIKTNVSDELVTYCDFDKSNGNGYQKVGMTLVQHATPSYFWTNGNNVVSRYKAQKKQLAVWLPGYNVALTEAENMFNAGYRRFSTCGNLKFKF